MSGGKKWMERKYVASNGVVERTRFLVGRSAKPRKKKEGVSSERKQEANRNSAVHQLGRLMNNNFGPADYFLTLEYSPKERKAFQDAALAGLQKKHTGEDTKNAVMKAARDDAMEFIRRLRRICKKAGVELRFILVTSDRDRTGKKWAGVHHHLLISGDAVKIVDKALTVDGRSLESIWGHAGTTGWEGCRAGDMTKLAAYLIKQVREIKNWKKWTTSRNLVKIVPEEYEVGPGTDPTAEIKVPAGATVQERLHFGEQSSCQYVRYIPAPKQPKRGGHKREGAK